MCALHFERSRVFNFAHQGRQEWTLWETKPIILRRLSHRWRWDLHQLYQQQAPRESPWHSDVRTFFPCLLHSPRKKSAGIANLSPVPVFINKTSNPRTHFEFCSTWSNSSLWPQSGLQSTFFFLLLFSPVCRRNKNYKMKPSLPKVNITEVLNCPLTIVARISCWCWFLVLCTTAPVGREVSQVP